MRDFGPLAEKTIITWEFEGAFSILFKEADSYRKMVAAGLKADRFRIHSIRFECDIAACAHMKIVGMCGPSHDGIQVGESFIGYSHIESIVSADREILWR